MTPDEHRRLLIAAWFAGKSETPAVNSAAEHLRTLMALDEPELAAALRYTPDGLVLGRMRIRVRNKKARVEAMASYPLLIDHITSAVRAGPLNTRNVWCEVGTDWDEAMPMGVAYLAATSWAALDLMLTALKAAGCGIHHRGERPERMR